MKQYTFITDAVTQDIQAETANLAAQQFAADNCLGKVSRLEELIKRIVVMGGWITVELNGVVIIKTTH